jgi:hypothetical protein
MTATALLGTAPLEALGDNWPLLLTLVLPYLLMALFSNLAEGNPAQRQWSREGSP